MLLTVDNLHKAYAAPVLTGVSLEVRAGEVHALVGENGAGKSTLAKIIAGLVAPDAGEMRWKGQRFAPTNKAVAEASGVRLVLQELNLIPTLSLAENIFLDQMPRRFGVVNYRRLSADAQRVLALVGLESLDPATPAGALGIGQQQLVEIAASLARRTELLILDEPTAALTATETELLFAQIRRLRAQGAGILYISHRLEELRRIADRISVLRDGQMIATHQADAVTIPELVRQMVGREISAAVTRQREIGDVALRIAGLKSGALVRNVSFAARRGEILGLAGLMGSGRTETLRAIFGADWCEAGEIYLHGSERPARIDSPRDAVRQGMAFVTEDRRTQGLLLPQSLRANITLARLRTLAGRFGVIDRQRERATAEQFIQQLAVRCASMEQPAAELSGGNQQKAVIARWLCRAPEILLFDEPTRGIDVGAKLEIWRLLNELAAQGCCIVVASSELEELMALCDRIAVLSVGRLIATFERGAWSQDEILRAAFSEHATARKNA
ncbi:MAG: sugar ABC transporter ATP-binding protein [Blastocatellia bacterium]